MGVAGGGVALGHGVVQRARVRWSMGSSVSAVSFSVVFLVSVGGMMSTLGYELGGFCMACTLEACAGEGGRGVVGLLTTCIVGFVFPFPVGSLGSSMGASFRWEYVGRFLVMEGTDCAKLFVTYLNWGIFERTCECL